MRVEVFNHKLTVHLVLEPVLTFHGLKEAVGDAVRHHHLDVLVLEVVLEVVIVGVVWLHAPIHLWSNVEKDREV